MEAPTPLYQTINNSGLSDADIEKILEEEEAKMIQEVKNKTIDNWKPGMRRRPMQLSYSLEEFEYELEPEKKQPRWTLLDKRCGALAIKVGMMPVWDEWGVRHPCTVLYLDNNVVLGHKTEEEHGYYAVQVATGQRKRKNVGKSVLGQYAHMLESDEENPPYLVREFRVTDPEHLIPLHSKIHARHFCPGQNVDIAGTSKGKGFQGAMKRHNFKGMPATHGVSKSHRALGSTGQCQDPGKVFKGKKMAGRMGTDRVTVQNLRIIKIDRGRNLIFVEGAVPGNKGNWVEIRDAVKKPLWRTDKVLDGVDRPPLPTFEFDESIDGCGQGGHEAFMPIPQKDPLAPDVEDDA
jgi:large subunit ribosomal protein L3